MMWKQRKRWGGGNDWARDVSDGEGRKSDWAGAGVMREAQAGVMRNIGTNTEDHHAAAQHLHGKCRHKL